MPHFIQIKINDVSIKAELNNSAAAQEIISAVITSMELPVLNALILNAAMISTVFCIFRPIIFHEIMKMLL